MRQTRKKRKKEKQKKYIIYIILLYIFNYNIDDHFLTYKSLSSFFINIEIKHGMIL